MNSLPYTSLNEVDLYIEQLEATLATLEAKTLRKDPEEARKRRRKKENKHKIILSKMKRLRAKEDGRSCQGVTGKSLENFREMVKKFARE